MGLPPAYLLPREEWPLGLPRLPQMFCCKAGNEIWGLGFGGKMGKRRSAGRRPLFLAAMACGLAADACCI